MVPHVPESEEAVGRVEGYFTEKDRDQYYMHVHRRKEGSKWEPSWKGVRVVKFPSDLALYWEVIFKLRPDYIIEAGTCFGGSSLFFADILLLAGGKRVFSIDVEHREDLPEHHMLEYVTGSSIDPDLVRGIRKKINGTVMVVLDSDHRKNHVAAELEMFKDVVSVNQYMVVEDCWTKHSKPYPPYYAVQEFLAKDDRFKRVDIERKFVFAVTRDGWLRKMK